MSIYRQYEDPRKLEVQLGKLQARYDMETNEDELIYLAMEIAELEERINFAYQDEEYDENY